MSSLVGDAAAIAKTVVNSFNGKLELKRSNHAANALTSNTNQGHYDPVYPPEFVNLHWHYEDWPTVCSPNSGFRV